MSFARRLLASFLIALASPTVLAPVLASPASADPDINNESAPAVIDELRGQGYDVSVNGVPSGDTALLTTCVVTAINKSGNTSTDPTSKTAVSVDVACPIQRG